MIRLYLVRHGAAEDAAAGAPDALRTLSLKARRRFHKTARSFGRKLDLILTSPLVRAVQTAEILAGEVKHGALAVLQELAPEEPPEAVLRAVSKRAGKAGSVALVGHEPQLSRLLAAMAHLPAAKAAKLDIRPGAVVRVDVSALPQAKSAEARWWIKSRGRHKGLPFKSEEPRESAPPAAKKKAAGKTNSFPKKPAATKSAPAKKAAAKKPVPQKAAPKPKPAAARPAPRPAGPTAAPTPSAAPSAPQKFMGSPRPPGPPQPRPAAPPPAAAPPAPPQVEEKPPDSGNST
jgi:phosphohistidine phosphatase